MPEKRVECAGTGVCARAIYGSDVDSRCGGVREIDVTELVQSVSMVEGVMVVLDPHVVEVIVRVVANSVDVLVLVTGE